MLIIRINDNSIYIKEEAQHGEFHVISSITGFCIISFLTNHTKEKLWRRNYIATCQSIFFLHSLPRVTETLSEKKLIVRTNRWLLKSKRFQISLASPEFFFVSQGE